MTKEHIASAIFDCSIVVGSWSTAHLPHDQALLVQRELIKISAHLKEISYDIGGGIKRGIYDPQETLKL